MHAVVGGPVLTRVDDPSVSAARRRRSPGGCQLGRRHTQRPSPLRRRSRTPRRSGPGPPAASAASRRHPATQRGTGPRGQPEPQRQSRHTQRSRSSKGHPNHPSRESGPSLVTLCPYAQDPAEAYVPSRNPRLGRRRATSQACSSVPQDPSRTITARPVRNGPVGSAASLVHLEMPAPGCATGGRGRPNPAGSRRRFSRRVDSPGFGAVDARQSAMAGRCARGTRESGYSSSMAMVVLFEINSWPSTSTMS